MNNICAVKRDVCRILETPYPVDLLQFKVDVISSNTPLLKEQLYSIKQEGENYYLYNLITKLDFYTQISSSIEFWHEGMTVSILDTNDVKVGTGCLIHEGIDMNKALTKEEILASDCIIKSEYQTLFDNALDTQLIPEKYLLKPSDPPASVTFYYDSRYLSVTRLNLSIYEIEEVEGSYSDLSERQIDKHVSPLNQKSSSKSYIVCQIGDILLVEEKEHPDYEYGYLIIGGIWDYNSTSNVELIKSNETASLSFEITLDCFATFTIYSPKYKITASVPGGYIAPTDGELIAILPDGYDFGFTLLAEGTTTPLYAKQGQEINLTMELTNYPSDVSQGTLHYISPIITVTYLENGVSTAKNLTSNIFTDTETTSECSFTMPASDCHITVQLRLTGEGADQYVEPTEGESGYALFVTGNIESVIINGFYDTIPATVIALDKVNISFTRKLGHSYTYSLYYTASGNTIKGGAIFSDYIEVDVLGNLTLNILELETDCVYTSATGKLSLDENWDNDNPIIGHNYYNNRSYTVDTENPLQTSGINNNFRNKSITGITFNSTNDLFHIYNNAFKDCNILINTSINGPKSISVGSSSFENTASLRFADWTENITRLSEKSFKHSGILEYSSNPDITNIPKLAFLNCYRLESVSLHNSNLTSIEECAFENCSNLSSISIPKCIQGINKYAFRYSGIPSITTSSGAQLLGGCTFITDSISPEISVIKEGVFQGCENLKDIYLPDSIEHLETLSFAECNNIQNFSSPGLKTIALGAFKDTWIEGVASEQLIEDENANSNSDTWSSKLFKMNNTSGILFDTVSRSVEGLNKNFSLFTYISPDETNTNLILYSCCDKLRGGILDNDGWNYYLHKNTISISPYACSGNLNIQNFQCLKSNRLKSIGDYAFKNNRYISHISMPESGSVLNLGTGAFYGCTRLSEVTQFTQQSIIKIPDYCFYKCGDNKYGIGASVDAGFMNLEFYIPDSVTEIGNYAFADCPQLMAIANLPTCKITKIGDYAFKNCFNNATWKAAYGKYVGLKVAYYTCMIIMTICTFGAGAAAQGLSNGEAISQLATSAINSIVDGAAVAGYYIPSFVKEATSLAPVIGGAMAGGTAGIMATDSAVSMTDAKLLRTKARSNTSEVPLPYLVNLGKGSFMNCEYISGVVLNLNLQTIPDYAFYNCKRLARLMFVDDSFVNGEPFTKTILPNIKSVGKEAFYKCKNLDYDFVMSLLMSVEKLEDGTFNNAKMFTGDDENNSNDLVLVIPDTILTIGDSALAFSNKECSVAVFISQNPTNLKYHANIFGNNSPVKTICIPKGTLDLYKPLLNGSFDFLEIELTDDLWLFYKEIGYTIPWLTD